MDNLRIVIHEYPENEDIVKDGIEVRIKVFIDEQKFDISGERDGQESNAIHFILYKDDKAIGNCRFINKKDYFKLTRMAILKEHRGKGYAGYMMK